MAYRANKKLHSQKEWSFFIKRVKESKVLMPKPYT